MTPEDFQAFRDHVGTNGRPLSDRATAELLGCSVMSVRRWSTEKEAPRYIGLACSAVLQGLSEWQAPR